MRDDVTYQVRADIAGAELPASRPDGLHQQRHLARDARTDTAGERRKASGLIWSRSAIPPGRPVGGIVRDSPGRVTLRSVSLLQGPVT